MECRHEQTTIDDVSRSKVCRECGIVLEESELVESHPIHFDLKPARERSERYWLQLDLIRSLCGRFGLGEALAERACNIFLRIAEGKAEHHMVSRGEKGRIVGAVSVMLANRQTINPAALSVADLASAIDVPVLAVGKCLYAVKKHLPEIEDGREQMRGDDGFIERFYEETVKGVLAGRKIVLTDPSKLISLAKMLYKVGRSAWLDVGRKPEPYAMSCLLLTLSSILPDKKVFRKAEKLAICKAYSLSYGTVSDREEEMKRMLVRRASELVPWPVDGKNVVMHLPDIVRVLYRLEEISGGGTNGDPPAFEAAERQRARMGEKIRLARERVLSDTRTAESEEDLVLDQLIRLNVGEAEIGECSNLGQLYSLLALHEPFPDLSDSE